MVYYTTHYVLNVDKIKDLEDVKTVLRALSLSFDPNCPTLDMVKDLCDLKPKASTQEVSRERMRERIAGDPDLECEAGGYKLFT